MTDMTVQTEAQLEKIQMIPLSMIRPNPQQPREYFDPVKLTELASSIAEVGLQQPVTVEGPHEVWTPQPGVHKRGRKSNKDITKAAQPSQVYYLIAGERRFRATGMVGQDAIKCIVKPPMNGDGPEKRSVLAVIENVQRADLSPIEEAKAFMKLKSEFGLSNVALGHKLGISSARVQMRLRLLELDEPIQRLIGNGRLSKDPKFVDALLSIPDSELRVKLAESLASRNASAKAGVEACTRLLEKMKESSIPENELPALKLSARKSGDVNRPLYDVMAAAGKAPPWPLTELCARKVCSRCELRDWASASTCRGCTLVEFLQEMIGKVNNG